MIPQRARQLKYIFTNETLEAIIAGLNIRPSDCVLAVAGSGDQAFALLESGCRITAIDNISAQIRFVQRRALALSRGDYSEFLDLSIPEECRGLIFSEYEKMALVGYVKKRERFFLEGDRLMRIQANLGNLEVVEALDLFRFVQGRKFTKVYLSNVLGYSYENCSEVKAGLRALARSLPINGLIYVSNHGSLEYLFSKDTPLKPAFLPEELFLDRDLTESAVKHETNAKFIPGVYRKIGEEGQS